MTGLDADVVVIGAGPAGTAAAIRLAEAGHEVVVLERSPERAAAEDHTSGEVLAPHAQDELALLDVPVEGGWVLDHFDAVRNVFPGGRWIRTPLPDGFRYVHVHRPGLEAVLRDRARRAGAVLVHDARVADVERGSDRAVVRTEDGQQTARLVIDAGGRNAPSVRRLDLKVEEPGIRQLGVALFFSAFDGTPLHTWDRHFTGGPGGMISGSRIEAGVYRYILECDLEAKQRSGAKPAEWFEAVAAAQDPWIAERLATQPRLPRVWSMAPIGYRIRELCRDRLLLVGDAAGYLSPVTGQGIEFAMRTARLAAEAASAALKADDCTRAAFASYVAGHRCEVDAGVAMVRAFLHLLRDDELLRRAPHDDHALRELLGPLADLPGQERGVL